MNRRELVVAGTAGVAVVSAGLSASPQMRPVLITGLHYSFETKAVEITYVDGVVEHRNGAEALEAAARRIGAQTVALKESDGRATIDDVLAAEQRA